MFFNTYLKTTRITTRGIHRVPFFYAIKKTQTFQMGSSGFSHNNSLRARETIVFYEKIYSLICLCVLPPPRGAKPLSQIKIFLSECQDLAWWIIIGLFTIIFVHILCI